MRQTSHETRRIFGQNHSNYYSYFLFFCFFLFCKLVNISAMVVRAGLLLVRGQLQIVFHKMINFQKIVLNEFMS